MRGTREDVRVANKDLSLPTSVFHSFVVSGIPSLYPCPPGKPSLTQEALLILYLLMEQSLAGFFSIEVGCHSFDSEGPSVLMYLTPCCANISSIQLCGSQRWGLGL